jgi:acyl carrier protein
MKVKIEQVVHTHLLAALREKGHATARLAAGDGLVDALGFGSLELARVIAELELELDVEPFIEAFAITDVRTVADLCQAFVETVVEQQTNR